MKKAVALYHVSFENLGSWEAVIKNSYQLEYISVTSPILQKLNNADIDLLIILGGPIGVYQENEYPFLTKEIQMIQERLQNKQPTLGICLGAQLLARALGSNVYPNNAKEIGWSPLLLTEEGKKSCTKFLASELTSMFHWHGDTFDLPKEATLLASTPICKNQIFSVDNALGIQCHPEITADGLENWWIGHAAEIGQNNLDVKSLRNDSLKLASTLEKQSQIFIKEWLANLLG